MSGNQGRSSIGQGPSKIPRRQLARSALRNKLRYYTAVRSACIGNWSSREHANYHAFALPAVAPVFRGTRRLADEYGY